MINFEPENTHATVRTFGILDESIPSSFKASVINPTQWKAKKSLVESKTKQELDKFNEWILSFVPKPIKKTVGNKVKALKNKISKIYKTLNTPISTREIKTALKGVMKTFRVEGVPKMGYKTFL